ncbi:MAG: sulfotransferase domain-containing protein [bacterium]
MTGIHWLASYPKSGNTWLRVLLTNYLRAAETPASINDLDAPWTAATREAFDECVGLESADLTREQIDHYRPAVFERLATEPGEPVFLKIHDAFTYNANHAAIVSKAAAGVIYVFRNPLDVAVSYAHHRNDSVDETISAMACDDAVLAGTDRAGGQLPQTLLSWSAHVRSWLDQSNLRVHPVRYEDLVHDTAGTFAAIVRFACLEFDTCRLEKAVQFSRFEQLRAQELASGFAERQPTAVSFFRSGRCGSWRDDLTRAQVDRVVADHRDVMLRVGYLSRTGDLLC